MMDQLAAGYAAQGRNIEFSNAAVANSIWDSNASYEDKAALLQRAFEAHQLPRNRAIDAGGFNRIDYYAPLIKDSQETAGEGRFRDSVVGQDILIPTLGGNAVDYSSGGNYGAFVELKDKDGNIIFRTGHGDIRGAKSGTVTLPERTTKTEKTEATSVTTETPPTELSSLQPQPQENEIRKRVIPATSVRGKDKVVYERFDGERWMQGSGATAKEYKYLFEQQEYLRSEQGQINNPNQGLMVNDRLVQPVRREETDTNLVSQYTSYNNPRTTLNSTTIVAMGGIPGSTKTPMVMQTGGSQTAIIPESANAMMMRLSQQMLFHKLTS